MPRSINRRRVLLDMDGVLSNFNQAAYAAHDREPTPECQSVWYFYRVWGMTDNEFWSKCRGAAFWENIEPYPWASEFYHRISELFPVTICTSPSEDEECSLGKYRWLRKHLGLNVADTMVGQQKILLAHPRSILIDDSPTTIQDFQMDGGLTIGFKQPWNKFDNDWESALEVLEGLAR